MAVQSPHDLIPAFAKVFFELLQAPPRGRHSLSGEGRSARSSRNAFRLDDRTDGRPWRTGIGSNEIARQ